MENSIWRKRKTSNKSTPESGVCHVLIAVSADMKLTESLKITLVTKYIISLMQIIDDKFGRTVKFITSVYKLLCKHKVAANQLCVYNTKSWL